MAATQNGARRTRFLIISDTHGAALYPGDERAEPNLVTGFRRPLPSADVAIHCGDLTTGSSVREYEAAYALLREIDAPLKLVIPGNHDRCLDTAHWARTAVARYPEGTEQRARYETAPAAAREVIERARRDGVLTVLREGTYRFVLPGRYNGAEDAALTVFASPWTPSFGSWGFQYAHGAHEFPVPEGVDVAMTHGPPRGMLDRTVYGVGAGCPALLRAVARSRPRVHCFGHIHEAWGAKLVTWAEPALDLAAATDIGSAALIDGARSAVLEDLGSLNPGKADDAQTAGAKAERHRAMAAERCCRVDLCNSSATTPNPGPGVHAHPLEAGRQTLFVNAAIMNNRRRPTHLPWLVDLELRAATDEDRRAADVSREGIAAALAEGR